MKSYIAIPVMWWQLPIVASVKCKLSLPLKMVKQKNYSIWSDVFKNGFSEAMQNSKDKIALAKINLKEKIEVQYIESVYGF